MARRGGLLPCGCGGRWLVLQMSSLLSAADRGDELPASNRMGHDRNRWDRVDRPPQWGLGRSCGAAGEASAHDDVASRSVSEVVGRSG